MICFLLGAAFVVWTLLVFIVGFYVCSWDAQRRLEGKVPVDDYWKKRGMK